MNLKGFEFRHIAVLDALFTEQHVGKAANVLNISQPAVSNTLAWLREHFDDPLLVRVGNSLKLTPFANELRAPVRKLIVDFRTMAEARPSFNPSQAEGSVRLLMSHYEAKVLLPAIAKRITEEAPNLMIDSLGVNTDTNEFQRGEVDLIILNWRILHEDHGRESLFEDELVAVSCPSAGWSDVIDERAYFTAEHIIPKMPEPTMPTALDVISAVDAALLNLGRTRTIAMTVPYPLIFEMLPSRPWLATVPRKFVEHSNVSGLKISKLPFFLDRIVVGQQWHEKVDRDLKSLWLRKIVREAASSLETDFVQSPAEAIASG